MTGKSRFVIDSSALIKLNRDQPRDLYPSVWERVERLVADSAAVLPRECLEELNRGDDDLAAWARTLNNFVVEASEDVIRVVRSIVERHPDWVVEGKNAADPWVIAEATIRSWIILTDERPSPGAREDRNLRIPDVAKGFGVACLDFTGLVRNLGWRF